MGSRKKNKASKKHRHSSNSVDQESGTTASKSADKRDKKRTSVEDFSTVTVFNSPLVSLKALSIVLLNTLKSSLNFILAHWVIFLVSTLALIAISTVPLPPALDQERETVKDIGLFALYWVGLGVASSIGLGTGLHTFILYLGPHIAQVVIASNECNLVPE